MRVYTPPQALATKARNEFSAAWCAPANCCRRGPGTQPRGPFPGPSGGPLQGFSTDRTAAGTREPEPRTTGRERRLPYPSGVAGHAAGVRVPGQAGALRTRPLLRARGPGSSACPGTAAPGCSCLHWAVCFWDFSNADGVRGPLSRGTVIPLEAGL